MFDLENIFKQWVLATEEDITTNTIKVGLEHSWNIHEAKKCLQIDPTGLMSVLKLREAFKSYIKDHYLTVKELLDGEWNVKETAFKELRESLFEGDVKDLYDSFINLVTRFSDNLGRKLTQEDLDAVSNIEKILVDSMTNFNNGYKLKHEKFNNGNPLKTDNVKISSTLHRFNTLKEFVDSLKNTSSDNFICLSLIERTYNRQDTDYDKYYDTFFAFGIKNNGTVYIVSDRTVFDSPETYFKTRNPARDYDNKVDYSWFPYYKMKDVKEALSHTNVLMITDGSEKQVSENSIVHVFDNEGLIYISILFTLIFKKYFVDLDNIVEDRNWFGEEVKFLPSTESTALVVTDNSIQIASPSLDVVAESWTYDNKKIFNTGLFDFYTELYPVPQTDETSLSVDYIGSEEEFKKLAWWRARKIQYNHIVSKLQENVHERYNNAQRWLKQQFKNNCQSIIKFMLTNPVQTCSGKYCMSDRTDSDKPVFWKEYKEGKFLDTFDLTHTQEKQPRSVYQTSHPDTSSVLIDDELVYIYSGYYSSDLLCWFDDDNSQRTVSIELKLRSYSDFEKFFNLTNEDLPLELRRHFYSRSGPFTAFGWKPYDGNSILHFCDPMNDIRDPYNDMGFSVSIFMSKSKYNKLAKKFGYTKELTKEIEI